MANEENLLGQAAALLRGGAHTEPEFEERRRAWMDRYYLTQNPKVWEVRLNGSAVRLEDLDLRAIDGVAKANAVNWQTVVNVPLLDLAVALDLLAVAAEALGVTAPDVTVRKLLEYFELVDDTVPEPDPAPELDPLVPSTGPTTATPG